ncbi:YwqH-like family protein [Bombilactobacillus thymidiniphilus]|uniref:DUF5082 domain-containing protein n=1 Tax=Bombilactobacillus thymidiniphilus TaxID=2923363 RepID=A0ABY4PBA7_9LACO|nr:DUF5082 family protein [Bombilactobacillus thymidiniphilus]UQS83045.1 DUF5082 domain-containing protein [Bombilactobacillus thymidiniphilus]
MGKNDAQIHALQQKKERLQIAKNKMANLQSSLQQPMKKLNNVVSRITPNNWQGQKLNQFQERFSTVGTQNNAMNEKVTTNLAAVQRRMERINHDIQRLEAENK